MPRISDFAIVSLPPRPVLRKTARSRFDALSTTIEACFSEIGALIKEAGATLSDVPVVAFENPDADGIQATVCFPLGNAVPGNASVEAATLPAQQIVFCMYLGAYEGIQPVYEEMRRWIGEKGYPIPVVCYEQYYNGMDYPEEQYLTKVAMPLPWRR